MYQSTYKGINAFLKGTCQLILAEGKKRVTRGKTCFELPEPYMFKIECPTARICTIPERHWNRTLPYAESLWLASGRNDMDFISYYLSRMMDFSDDKRFMRGGYGPRFRHFNGSMSDYAVSSVSPSGISEIDQFKYVEECFRKDRQTRRAIISLDDPMKDDFDLDGHLKTTLDIPCTRILQFVKRADEDKLDLIVTMRSNDLIWGASGVNIFNFTFMQEYFSAILGLDVGNYYHVANNMHYYEDKRPMVEAIAKGNDVEDLPSSLKKTFHSLTEFDALIYKLSEEEALMRTQGSDYSYYEFEDPFFKEWYNNLYQFSLNKTNK